VHTQRHCGYFIADFSSTIVQESDNRNFNGGGENDGHENAGHENARHKTSSEAANV